MHGRVQEFDALSQIIEVGGLVVAHRASGACQRLRWLADGKLRAWLVVTKHREWIADQQYPWCVAVSQHSLFVSCPDFAQGGEMRLYGLSTHGATRLMESEDVHCFAVCHQRMLLIVAFKLRIVTFDLTSLDSLHSLELAAEDQDADDGAYNMQVVGDQLFVAFPDLDMITSHDVVTLHMNARLGTTHLRRPTDVAGCDGVLLITEMEANALAICSMTGERLRTVCFEPVFEAIKPTSVTVIEQASGPSLMAVITQNWLLVLTLDGKVRQRVPACTRFQCARATEQRLLVSDIDAHIVHEFRFE